MIKHYDFETIVNLAKQGEAEFQYRLSRHYWVREKNYVEAQKWLQLAADQGYPQALIDLGRWYFYGEYVEKNAEKAEGYFMQAIAQGNSSAMVTLGSIYWRGLYIEQNKEKAINLWQQATELGDCTAWRKLGMCYFNGDALNQNYTEAVKCFAAADDKDMLGECYLNGLGVERDVEKAIELWETTCEEHPRCYYVMFKLGCLYVDGIEIEPDYEKAYQWWLELAHNDEGIFCGEGSFAEAIYKLACFYYEGKGVKKDTALAMKLFRNTIDAFYRNDDEAYYIEYDRKHHEVKLHQLKIEGKLAVPNEPDFIVHARKVLESNMR